MLQRTFWFPRWVRFCYYDYLRRNFTRRSKFTTACTFSNCFFFQSDNIFTTLVMTKWYNFNCANRKTFLLMLCNSMEPINLNFSKEIAINYRLGVAVRKFSENVRNSDLLLFVCRFSKRYTRPSQFSINKQNKIKETKKLLTKFSFH